MPRGSRGRCGASAGPRPQGSTPRPRDVFPRHLPPRRAPIGCRRGNRGGAEWVCGKRCSPGGGARLPSSPPLLRSPFPPWDCCAERLERGAGGGGTFRAEAAAGLWRCRSSLKDGLTEGEREGIPGCRAAPAGKPFDSLRAKASPRRVGRGSPETACGPLALTGPRGARPPKAAPGLAAPTWPCAAGVGQLRGRKQERGRPPLGVRSALPSLVQNAQEEADAHPAEPGPRRLRG